MKDAFADTLAEILKLAGFHAVATYDGRTALKPATWFRPDYLLFRCLDAPYEWVQLAFAIRKMHPATKVLLFSGQAGISHILLEGQNVGFEFDILAKPIHLLKLIERLKEQ